VFKNTNYKSVASHSKGGRGKNASARHACTDRQSQKMPPAAQPKGWAEEA